MALGNWIRVVDYKYSLAPLSSVGSIKGVGGRFNVGRDVNASQFPTFPALYIGQDGETALREKFSIKQEGRGGLSREELALTSAGSHSSVTISGNIENIFNLAKGRNLDPIVQIISKFKIPREVIDLGNSIGETTSLIRTRARLVQSLMKENWREEPSQFSVPANSQIFGRLVRDAGFDGIIYPSTKSSKRCLAIFPENLANSASHLEISGPYPEEIEHSSLNSDTWGKLV